jgi:hypothetical protein
MHGPQPVQPLLLSQERGLKGVRQLGVVHLNDPQAGFQLQNLDFSTGELQIDRFCHFFLF